MMKALDLPYPILVRRVEREDAALEWEAVAIDLPGCVAAGGDLNEVLDLIEDAQRAWLDTARERGMEIPCPSGQESYSGRISLRIPPAMHERATILAKMAGMSLNAYISTTLSHRVGRDEGEMEAGLKPTRSL
ncbi:MAG: toxin-antitoxin system HicB family antitoxin [Sulfobacillus sp.]